MQVPDKPAAPTTTVNALNTVLEWTAPYHGGVAISSYSISFLDSRGAYVEDKSVCDGASSAIITALRCTIPSVYFTQEPLELTWGSSIYARVVATNVRGSSV